MIKEGTMSTVSPTKTQWTILIPFVILFFYGLNIDTLLQYIRYNATIYQLLFLIFICGVSIIIPPADVRSGAKLPTAPMTAWVSSLVLLSLLRMMIGFDAEYAVFALRLLFSTVIMIATWLIGMRYVSPQRPSTLATLILLAIFAAACGSVVFDPYIDLRAQLDPLMIGTYDRSRAGGVFLQPNHASVSLALLYAAILPRVGPKTAIACTATVLLAIFLTFSRSGQILVALIIAISLMRGYLPRATLGLVTGTVTLFLAGSFFQNYIVDAFGIDQGSGFVRLTDANRFYSADAFASDARTSLAESALADFSTSPWVGRGLGFSWKWGDLQFAGAGTHNIYLRYMLEYGVLGALIWPLFLLAAFKIRNHALDRSWSIGICVVGAVAGFFSHNIPEQGYILVVLIAALTLPAPQQTINGYHAI